MQATPCGQRSSSRYARHFSSLENPSTSFRIPSASIVDNRKALNAPQEASGQGAHNTAGDKSSFPQESASKGGRTTGQNATTAHRVSQAPQGHKAWVKCITSMQARRTPLRWLPDVGAQPSGSQHPNPGACAKYIIHQPPKTRRAKACHALGMPGTGL